MKGNSCVKRAAPEPNAALHGYEMFHASSRIAIAPALGEALLAECLRCRGASLGVPSSTPGAGVDTATL